MLLLLGRLLWELNDTHMNGVWGLALSRRSSTTNFFSPYAVMFAAVVWGSTFKTESVHLVIVRVPLIILHTSMHAVFISRVLFSYTRLHFQKFYSE